MWPAGKNRGGEPPLDPPPPDATERTAAHWLQPINWVTDSQPCSPAADLASHTNSNERWNLDEELQTITLAIDTQTSPTTAQKVLEGLGAQTTFVGDRVYDPSPIPHTDQPGNLAKETTTTDTTPGQRTRGVEDVKIEETGESLVSGHALRLPLQTPNSTVGPLSSSEAATACGAGPPEGAETPLSALGPQFQELRPHSTEALLRTEHQSCFNQDLLRSACHFCDYCPSKTLTEIDDIFTFNHEGYILFDQTKWAS